MVREGLRGRLSGTHPDATDPRGDRAMTKGSGGCARDACASQPAAERIELSGADAASKTSQQGPPSRAA